MSRKRFSPKPQVPKRVDVTSEIVIARPRAAVAAYAADPDTVTSWYRKISSVRWQTEPPLEIGSELAFVAKFLGQELAYTYAVLEYEPGERFVMRTAEGPFPMQTTYTWQDVAGDATRMTLQNRGEPSGYGSLTVPFIGWAIRRANRGDLRRLKRVLEKG